MASTNPQRRARDWVRVLERHPEGIATLPDWCWLDMPGKVRAVAEHLLEFTKEEPSQ
jgi:hypothetical protein